MQSNGISVESKCCGNHIGSCAFLLCLFSAPECLLCFGTWWVTSIKEEGTWFHFCSVTWWSKHTTGKWELVIQKHFDWGVIKPGLQFPSEYFRHSTIKQSVGAITNTITPMASFNWHSDNPTHWMWTCASQHVNRRLWVGAKGTWWLLWIEVLMRFRLPRGLSST